MVAAEEERMKEREAAIKQRETSDKKGKQPKEHAEKQHSENK